LKPSEGDIITDTKVPSSNKIHDTEKPVTLIEKFVLLSSDENQIVLDPFGGSGSTGKACIRNNRKFILIEKEEKTFSLMKEEIIEATRKHEEETIFPIIEAEDEEEEENEEGDVNIENGLDRRDTIREDEFSSS
jgi:DNA modification methylase